jgi:hypothetical protein
MTPDMLRRLEQLEAAAGMHATRIVWDNGSTNVEAAITDTGSRQCPAIGM